MPFNVLWRVTFGVTLKVTSSYKLFIMFYFIEKGKFNIKKVNSQTSIVNGKYLMGSKYFWKSIVGGANLCSRP